MHPDRTVGSTAADDAFSRYVVPEIEVLLRVATSLTGNRVDAEDLVQETLLRAYRAIERFDGRHPRAWLLTIMRNAQRNRVRRRRPGLLDDPDLVLPQIPDRAADAGNVETVVVDNTFDAAVVEAFDRLPPRFRRVVELVDLGELTYAEAAEVLDVPIGTIMSRLHRSRRRIRQHLQASGITPRRAR